MLLIVVNTVLRHYDKLPLRFRLILNFVACIQGTYMI